jgi:hypothetical protein
LCLISLYTPSDRLVSAKLVQTFASREYCVVSTTVPYGRIFGFLDWSPYFFFEAAPQLYSRGWVHPVPDPLLLRKSGSTGNRTRDLWICSQELWPLDHKGGHSSLADWGHGVCFVFLFCLVSCFYYIRWIIALLKLKLKYYCIICLNTKVQNVFYYSEMSLIPRFIEFRRCAVVGGTARREKKMNEGKAVYIWWWPKRGTETRTYSMTMRTCGNWTIWLYNVIFVTQ